MTVEHILQEIEFELAQGTISRDELGESLQAVRQYQNKLRSDVFQAKDINVQDALTRQFQMNDMLLTMLQETVAALHALQLKTEQVAQLPPPTTYAPTAVLPTPSSPSSTTRAAAPMPALPAAAPSLHNVEAKRDTRIQQQSAIRPSNLPLIGSFITRLRGALHSLTLFYVNKLADQQQPINATYGDTLLQLHAQQQAQQQLIAHLQAQLADQQGDEG